MTKMQAKADDRYWIRQKEADEASQGKPLECLRQNDKMYVSSHIRQSLYYIYL